MKKLQITTTAIFLLFSTFGLIAQQSSQLSKPCKLAIGDTYAGGIIFYLDPSGCHGLVSAMSDQTAGIKWHNTEDVNTFAYGNGIGAGVGNTSAINFWQQGTSGYATRLCYNTLINGFQDWYLPSKYELNLMYQNIGQGNALGLGNVGGFTGGRYWSSTEHWTKVVWYQDFTSGVSDGDLKSKTYAVRAVRAF